MTYKRVSHVKSLRVGNPVRGETNHYNVQVGPKSLVHLPYMFKIRSANYLYANVMHSNNRVSVGSMLRLPELNGPNL